MAQYRSRPCSLDDSFEYIECAATKGSNSSPTTPDRTNSRTPPLTQEQFSKLLDAEGRLVDEHALRQAVFLGGVDPSIRKEVWQFLFGLYPCTSTGREREVLRLDNYVKYRELKSRWKTMLVVQSKPGASPLEQGLVAKYQQEVDEDLPSPDKLSYEDPGDRDPEGNSSTASPAQLVPALFTAQKNKTDLSESNLPFDITSPDVQQRMEFMKLQSQVYVNRQQLDMDQLRTDIRIIDKDVPRTDRDYEYFLGKNNPHLTQLREALITFAAFQTDIGYAQGMNDIMARFLVVFNSEVEAYWCFTKYMISVKNDFDEEGMVQKIDLVRKLLEQFDNSLISHLESHDLGDLLFCHRWLLLGFKREFNFDDSLRCFEILSSHHLELSSLEAANARRREQMKEFENQDGVLRTVDNLTLHYDYTFESFMCVALLIQCREGLLKCTDSAMVFQCINGLQIDLDDVLGKAESLFFQYCKRTVGDCFVLVDVPKSDHSKRRGAKH
ncbi:TBC1 domain family member 15-like [Liolophura sinensis]|uniref:TBC1 domain family member 15-like n=1 Tax=Liolophura sinensis TaxID=3198878 RepID=UPI00315890C5